MRALRTRSCRSAQELSLTRAIASVAGYATDMADLSSHSSDPHVDPLTDPRPGDHTTDRAKAAPRSPGVAQAVVAVAVLAALAYAVWNVLS